MAAKFCVDCKHHEFSGDKHVCWRQVKPQLSLVSGKMENVGVPLDCVVERMANYPVACRESGQYFIKEETATDG